MAFFANKEEVAHIEKVLRETQQALLNTDSTALQKLSDQTIHSASIYQHTDFLTIAILIYSTHKLLERGDKSRIKNWEIFVKKFNGELEKAIVELIKKDGEEFARHLEHAKDVLENLGGPINSHIQDIIKKAQVNKATKVYEHGISLSRTAQLLNLTPWELVEYIGQKGSHENPFTASIDEKKRAQEAYAFFS